MNYFDVKIIFILKVCTLPLEKGKIFSNYKKINLLMLRIKPFSLLKIYKIYLDKYIQNKFKKMNLFK